MKATRYISLPRVDEIVQDARDFSFSDPARIKAWANLFLRAHQTAPGGLSVEVGTWKGGTALVFLELLEELYHARVRPMLFTVDPYGQKPYDGGDAPATSGLYGPADYALAKAVLQFYPNHAHFHLEALEFVSSLVGRSYWHGATQRVIGEFSFVLLDGQHDAASIAAEVSEFGRTLKAGGVLIVDNVDNDPESVEVLKHSGLGFTIEQAPALPSPRDPAAPQLWAWYQSR